MGGIPKKTVINHVLAWFSALTISLLLLYISAFTLYGCFSFEEKISGLERLGEIVSSIIDISSSGSQTTYSENVATTLRVATVIFTSNAKINTLFAIPFVGTVVYGSAIAYTSTIGRYIAELIAGDEWENFFLTYIFGFPHTYFEFLAYSIATTESTWLGVLAIRRRLKKANIGFYLFSIALSFTILFIAALLEAIVVI